MKRSYKIAIIAAVIALLAAGGFGLYFYLNRFQFNEGLVYGNSAGNYYNGGLFCEANGYVYFSNPQDDDKLYRMLPDGRDAEKLCDDSVCFLNADSHHVYYARAGQSNEGDFAFLHFNTNSLCSIPADGGMVSVLDTEPTLYVTLVNNDLYYIHYDTDTASTLYKVRIDGKDKHMVTNDPLLLSPGQEGTLCYAGVTDDMGIALWNPETDTGSTIYDGICYHPIDVGERLYFMDASNDYHVTCLDTLDGTVTDLTGCRVDCYNLTQDYIYYQKNVDGEGAMCRKRLDGSGEEELIMDGLFSNIQVTSQYVYFSSYRDPSLVYQTPADNYLNVQDFYIQYKG